MAKHCPSCGCPRTTFLQFTRPLKSIKKGKHEEAVYNCQVCEHTFRRVVKNER